jgi:hypothetical protein
MTILTALDHDVQIVIKKKPRSRASGRISVEAWHADWLALSSHLTSAC